MKFKTTRAALLEGLQIVQNVVGARSTLPVLANVLVVAEKERLLLTTTDLDVTVRATVAAEVSEDGGTTLPVRRIAQIIRELPERDIEIEVDEKDMASVRCDQSFFKINGLPQDDFPPVAKLEGKYTYHLEQGTFKQMLARTAYAASTDETRQVLNGVFLSFRASKLTVVATDGRRLALIEQEIEVPKEAEADAVLPSKTVNELLHTLHDEGELKVTIVENQIGLEFGAVMLRSKLVEGTYPNYRQVIPGQCEERVTVERESLLTALKRVSLLATDKAQACKLTFTKNKLLVTSSSPDIGEARETLPIKYSAKDISIAFNPEYVMDPLRNLDQDEIFVELTDDLSPGVIKCDVPFLYVLMPMRIT